MSKKKKKPSSAAKQDVPSPCASDETSLATLLAEGVAERDALRRIVDAVPGTAATKVPLESEVLSKAVLAAMPDLLFGVSREGVILYCNAPDENDLYAAPEEFLGKKLDEVLPDSVGAKCRAFVRECLDTGTIQQFEYQLSVPKGFQYFECRMVVSGPGQVLAIVRNITARKQAQKALLESEKRFKSITETAADCIFIKDKARRYTFVNPAARQLMRLPEARILGKAPIDIFGPEQAQVIKEIDDRTFSGETVDETRVLVIGDKEYFLHTLQTPLTMEEGEVASIMGIVRDVTERKQAMERDVHDGVSQKLAGLRFLVASLRRDLSAAYPGAAHRAAQIEQIAGDALTSVRQISEGLERLPEEPDALVKALQKLAYRMGNLYGTPCRFTSRKPVLIQPSDIATHLFLIAQEAVSNALKHAKCSKVTISLSERNGSVKLVVKDDGVGFSRKTQREGMGMGIMRSRATLIGASFDVQAGKACGTIVTCSRNLQCRTL